MKNFILFYLIACVSGDLTCDSVKSLYQDAACCDSEASAIVPTPAACVDLKGPTGATGPVGATGPMGPAGATLYNDKLSTLHQSTNDEFSGVYIGNVWGGSSVEGQHTQVIVKHPDTVNRPNEYELYVPKRSNAPSILNGFEKYTNRIFTEGNTSNVKYFQECTSNGLVCYKYAFVDADKTILTNQVVFDIMKRVKKPSDFTVPSNWFNEFMAAVNAEANMLDAGLLSFRSMHDNWEKMRNWFQLNTLEQNYRDVFSGNTFRRQRFQNTGYDMTSYHYRLGYNGVVHTYEDCSFRRTINRRTPGRIIRVEFPISHLINQETITINLFSKVKFTGTGTLLDDVPYFRLSAFDRQSAFVTFKDVVVRNKDSFYFHIRMPLWLDKPSTIMMNISTTVTDEEEITIPVPSGYYYPRDLLKMLNSKLKSVSYADAYFDLKTPPQGQFSSEFDNEFKFVVLGNGVRYHLSGYTGPLFNIMKGNLNDETNPFGSDPSLFTPLFDASELENITGTVSYTHGPVAGTDDPNDVGAAIVDLLVRSQVEMHSLKLQESICLDGLGELSMTETWNAYSRGCISNYSYYKYVDQNSFNYIDLIKPLPGDSYPYRLIDSPYSWQPVFPRMEWRSLALAAGWGASNYFKDGGYYLIKDKFGRHMKWPILADLDSLTTPPLIDGSNFGIIRDDITAAFGFPNETVGVMHYYTSIVSRSDYVQIEEHIISYFKEAGVTKLIIDQRGNPGGYSRMDQILAGGQSTKLKTKYQQWFPIKAEGGVMSSTTADVFIPDQFMKHGLATVNASLMAAGIETLKNENPLDLRYDPDDDMWYSKDNDYLTEKLVGSVDNKMDVIMINDGTSSSAPQQIKNKLKSASNPTTGDLEDGSNVRVCFIGEEPHLFGSSSTANGYMYRYQRNDFPFEPTKRSQAAFGAFGKESILTDDRHSKYTTLHAIASPSYDNFLIGIGLSESPNISGIEWGNSKTYRDFQFEQALRAVLMGCPEVIADPYGFEDLKDLPQTLQVVNAPPAPPPLPDPVLRQCTPDTETTSKWGPGCGWLSANFECGWSSTSGGVLMFPTIGVAEINTACPTSCADACLPACGEDADESANGDTCRKTCLPDSTSGWCPWVAVDPAGRCQYLPADKSCETSCNEAAQCTPSCAEDTKAECNSIALNGECENGNNANECPKSCRLDGCAPGTWVPTQ